MVQRVFRTSSLLEVGAVHSARMVGKQDRGGISEVTGRTEVSRFCLVNQLGGWDLPYHLGLSCPF